VNNQKYPKIAIFDLTAIGDYSATGQIKKNLFGEWPQAKILGISGAFGANVKILKNKKRIDFTLEAAFAEVMGFNPDLIFYRPVPENQALHRFAMNVIKTLDRPFVTWIVDDWPSSLEEYDPLLFKTMDRDFRFLLSKSSWNFSISAAMSSNFGRRYGVNFEPLANGVIPSEWVPVNKVPLENRPFKVRYAGGLAENMNRASFIRLANAIEELSTDLRIKFEVLTKPHWWDAVKSEVGHFGSIKVDLKSRSPSAYRNWLKHADCVVILYNFDELSIKYIADSFANKFPECLASGSALLMHGPSETATISYAEKQDCATVVNQPSVERLKATITDLIRNDQERARLINNARSLAFKNHNLDVIRQGLYSRLKSIATSFQKAPVFREFDRQAAASLDETAIIFELSDHISPKTMIDVGGHTGGSSRAFAKKDWSIFAFEPDPKNRRVFTKNLGHMKNVVLDARAIGEKAATGVPFFTSKESSGISGMLAFRDTHEQTTTVNVTTIAQIIKENSLERIDFLKIDAEGYDFSVLKGVPWGIVDPNVIECEFEDAKTNHLGHNWRDICNYLMSHGYSVYLSEWHPIVRYGISHDWHTLKKYPCELNDENAWGNFLAFKDDPGEANLAKAVDKVLHLKRHRVEPIQGVEVEKSDMPRKITNSSNGLSLGERLRLKSPVLFRVAQFSKWSLFFFRRHISASILAVSLIGICFLTPVFFSAFSPYKWILWSISIAVILSVFVLVAVAFANLMAQRIATRQNAAHADLKSSMMEEMRQAIQRDGESLTRLIDGKLDEKFDMETNRTRRATERLSTRIMNNNKAAKRLNERLESKLNQVEADKTELQARIGSLQAELRASKQAVSDAFSQSQLEMKKMISGMAERLEMTQYKSAEELEQARSELEHKLAELNNSYKSSLQSQTRETKKMISGMTERLEMKSSRYASSEELEKACSELEHKLAALDGSYQSSLETQATEMQNLASGVTEVSEKIDALNRLKSVTEKIGRRLDQTAVTMDANSKKIAEFDAENESTQQRLKVLNKKLKTQLSDSTATQKERLKAWSADIKSQMVSADSVQADKLDAFRASVGEQVQTLETLVSQMSSRMDAESNRNSTSFARSMEQLEARLDALKSDRLKSNNDAEAFNATVQKNIAEVRAEVEQFKQLKVATNKIRRRLDQAAVGLASGAKDAEATRKLNADLQVGLAEIRTELEQLKDLKNTTSKIKRQIDQTALNMLENSTKISKFDKNINELEHKLSSTELAVAKEKSKAGVSYHHFNRVLLPKHVKEIQNNWLKPLNLNETKKSLAYAAERINIVERNLKGRLATSVENALLRTLIAKSVKGKKLRVLEVGVLFGVGLAIIHEIAADGFEDVHYTAIDPLEGYYGNNVPDLITHAKVNKKNLLQNIELAKIPLDQFTLIEGFSTDDDVVKAASKKLYDLLIIDGDHSYAGVKADFVNFAPYVKRGGYIIIDDDSTPEWPRITEYVDEELIPREDIVLIGRSWRSAVFQVIKKVKI
jgi:FkbM family methyltransferase